MVCRPSPTKVGPATNLKLMRMACLRSILTFVFIGRAGILSEELVLLTLDHLLLPGNATCRDKPQTSDLVPHPVKSCSFGSVNADGPATFLAALGRMSGRLKLRRSCSLLPGNATCSDKLIIFGASV